MTYNWRKISLFSYISAGFVWTILAFLISSIENCSSYLDYIFHHLETKNTASRNQPTPEDNREPVKPAWDKIKGQINQSVVMVGVPISPDILEVQKYSASVLQTVNWTVPFALEWLQHKLFLFQQHGARSYLWFHSTGIVYGDGHKILTAAHAVSNATNSNRVEVEVLSDNGRHFLSYPAHILDRDDIRDIALLEVSDWQGKPLPISPYRAKPGSEVMAVRMKGLVTVDYSFITSKVKSYGPMDLSNYPQEDWLITNNPFEGGFSGGPVLNERGEIVGVVSGTNSIVGLSVPIDRATY